MAMKPKDFLELIGGIKINVTRRHSWECNLYPPMSLEYKSPEQKRAILVGRIKLDKYGFGFARNKAEERLKAVYGNEYGDLRIAVTKGFDVALYGSFMLEPVCAEPITDPIIFGVKLIYEPAYTSQKFKEGKFSRYHIPSWTRYLNPARIEGALKLKKLALENGLEVEEEQNAEEIIERHLNYCRRLSKRYREVKRGLEQTVNE
jgi:hypothetical protein